jgi:CBS domain-containing protein
MRNRTVAEVMSTEVVAVVPGTPYLDVVWALGCWRISGVPVLDDARRVIGVVSESDLLRKHEFRGRGRQPRFERRSARLARAKAAGDNAGEIMTTPAVTLRPRDTVVTAARVLAGHGIRRAPVVDESGELVGIVTRGDLLRVFLRPDAEIAADVTRWLTACGLAGTCAAWTVRSHKGIVSLTGRVARHDLVAQAGELAGEVDGVVDVVNQLTCVETDPAGATST